MEYLFRSAHYKIQLLLAGKFNVIIGDSGTGKTLLCKELELIRRTTDIAEEQPCPVCAGHYAAEHLDDWANSYSGALLVLDEVQSDASWRQAAPVMMRSHNYYIICAREGHPSIPYGFDTTFFLERTNNKIWMSPAFNHDKVTRNPRGFSSILTEDEGLGFDIVRRRASTSVKTARGKDKLNAALQTISERALTLMDLCGAGKTLPKILYSAEKGRHIVYDSRSFEHEVMSSIFAYYNTIEYSDYCLTYDSEEAFYIEQLRHVLRKLYNLGCDKNKQELVELFTVGRAYIHGQLVTLSDHRADVTALYPFLDSFDRPTTIIPKEPVNKMKLSGGQEV